MKSILILGLLSSSVAFTAVADTKIATSTYVLEVASNLDCAQLQIEMISADEKNSATLVFGEGAFSAAELAPGEYSFGTITCVEGHRGTEKIDLLAQCAARARQLYSRHEPVSERTEQ